MSPPLEMDSNWLVSTPVMWQKLSSEDRLSYLQMKIGQGLGTGREEGLLLDFEGRDKMEGLR